MTENRERLAGRGALVAATDQAATDPASNRDAWIDFLSRHARLGRRQGSGDDRYCFVARNFALDEGILEERSQEYEQAGGLADHGSLAQWKGVHEAYLRHHVFLQPDDDGPPEHLDPDEPLEMPGTFRYVDPESPFLETDPQVHLIRVEELDFIANRVGIPAARLRSLIEQSRSPQSEQALNEILSDWHHGLDQRPVFAGFWQDVKDLFEPVEEDSWADSLRNRLGLAHFDPAARNTRTQDVVVFRYPVSVVPRILRTGGKRRPLVTPTVLDSSFSDPFCPSPREQTTGHVVHLQPEAGKLRREVLHPRPRFRASHLWRLGTLTQGFNRRELPEQRAIHLLLIRDAAGRDDYAEGTDWDLFQ